MELRRAGHGVLFMELRQFTVWQKIRRTGGQMHGVTLSFVLQGRSRVSMPTGRN
jgi:hypothetical protein